jgi:hypothetical protein
MMLVNKKACFRIFRISVIIICLLGSSVMDGMAQRNDTPPLRERLFFGGSFGLQLGSVTDIQVSPVIGIWVLPRIAIATGPTYRFYKDYFFRTNIYGGRAYTQLVVIQDINSIVPIGSSIGIFIHAENELLSLESESWKNPPYGSDRFYVNTLLAGAGISQPIGRRSSFNIMVLWALNDSQYGIYSNPEIRISFIF